MTEERDSPASTRAGKRRTPRKRPESEVDRKGLAAVIGGPLSELYGKGVKQEDVARQVGCGASTLRHMQHGTGTSHYGHELLTRVAKGLDLEKDELVNAFYPPVPRDPASPSGAEMTAQEIMDQLAPYLAHINAIPTIQTGISGVQKDVAGLQERLNGMARDVQEVRSQLENLIDINQPPPDPDAKTAR